MNALCVTPRQLFEASRRADRCGNAFVQQLDGGRMLVLLATNGQPEPDLALELDRDGEVIARQVLSLRRRDHDDGLEDFSEEQPLPPPVDVSHARPAPLCGCAEPRDHDGATCHRCGHTLREEAGTLPHAA